MLILLKLRLPILMVFKEPSASFKAYSSQKRTMVVSSKECKISRKVRGVDDQEVRLARSSGWRD